MVTNSDQPRQPEPTDRRRLILSVGWSLLIFVLCLFLPAGTLAWSRGWLFFVVTVAASILITVYLRRVNPDVVAARVNRHEGTKGWDRVLLRLFLPALVSILTGGSPGRRAVSLVSRALVGLWNRLCAADHRMVGLTWAESVNKFFEPTVRIQTDRGHTGHRQRSIRHRPTSGVRVGLPCLHRHAPFPRFLVGIDPSRHWRACSWSCERSGKTEP